MTHTPGPWHLNGYAYKRDESAPTGRRVFICSPEASFCAGLTVDGTNGQVCQLPSHRRLADARLIAAAPELLSALKRFAKAMEQKSYPELQGVACDAFAAIAKATGA